MNVLLIGVIIVFLLLIVAAVVFTARMKGATKAAPPAADHYTCRPTLFSPAERSFLGVMDGVLPDGVSWLGKVRLGDVFVTRKGLTDSERTSARNRIDRKHVDFLLVRVSDFAPLAGIELDDSSHDADDRKARDTFVDEVFRSANLPLLHIRAQAAYTPAELRAKITALLA